jgi:methylated-DNA-[protein]-cysteine S-methyltransferase
VNVATHPTPAGPFTVVADDDGVVVASGWTTALGEGATRRRDLGAASTAVRAYLGGELDAVCAVPVRQSSGPVVERGWDVLRSLRGGEVITYTELARRCGLPGSARAASAACARNAVALFVPCHRVVRTGGGLGGFRWGLEVKRWLLDFERDAEWR